MTGTNIPETVRLNVGLMLDEHALDAIAQRAAALVLAQLEDLQHERVSPWLYGAKAAAEYLSWPIGRVQKLTAAGVLPHVKLGQRCAYRRDQLDGALDAHREGRLP